MKYILMAIIYIPFLSFCAITVNNFFVDKKQNRKISPTSIYTLSALIVIIISFFSYITNMGYIRLVLSIPLYLYTLIFFCITWKTSSLAKKSKKLNISIIVTIVSFLIANICLPDNAGYGYNYALFNCVNDQNITYVLNIVAIDTYILSIISLIVQTVLFLVVKRNQNAPNSLDKTND